MIRVAIQSEIREQFILEIYDEVGRQMYRTEINGEKNNEFTIPTRHFANGAYILKIMNEKGNELSRKMIRMDE